MSSIFKKYIITKTETTKIMVSPVGVKLNISLASKPILQSIHHILAVQWDLDLAILLPDLLLLFLNTISYLGKQMRRWQIDIKTERSEGNSNVSFINLQVCSLVNQVLWEDGKGLSSQKRHSPRYKQLCASHLWAFVRLWGIANLLSRETQELLMRY